MFLSRFLHQIIDEKENDLYCIIKFRILYLTSYLKIPGKMSKPISLSLFCLLERAKSELQKKNISIKILQYTKTQRFSNRAY
jgi:hypothetical protein